MGRTRKRASSAESEKLGPPKKRAARRFPSVLSTISPRTRAKKVESVTKTSQGKGPTSTKSKAGKEVPKSRRRRAPSGKPETKDKLEPSNSSSIEGLGGESVDKKPVNVWKSSGRSSMNKLVGAHVSAAGGLHHAVTAAVAIGANAFALFLRSQRTWNSKPLSKEIADQFKAACLEHDFPARTILPHGSYLLNLGSPDEQTLQKSREALVDEMQRCEMLGLTKYNFHPGSTCGKISVNECIGRITESINLALDRTAGVTAVVENMSCQGNTIGGRLEELRSIVAGVKDKSRVGVCLDTCHAFAAGFDIRTQSGYYAFMDEFDKVVGLHFLQGMHLNDSKGELGCHLDRHENIGRGKLGLDTFRWLMNDPRLDTIPLILETPAAVSDEKEITLLRSLVRDDILPP